VRNHVGKKIHGRVVARKKKSAKEGVWRFP